MTATTSPSDQTRTFKLHSSKRADTNSTLKSTSHRSKPSKRSRQTRREAPPIMGHHHYQTATVQISPDELIQSLLLIALHPSQSPIR
eukprot:24449_5